MASLKDIISLLGDNPSPSFIMDENGEPKLVVMGIDKYRVLVGSTATKVNISPLPPGHDPEIINRKIVEAQLQADHSAEPVRSSKNAIASVGTSRAKPERIDLRSEVMDPNFDYSAQLEDEDEEAIRTTFDDI